MSGKQQTLEKIREPMSSVVERVHLEVGQQLPGDVTGLETFLKMPDPRGNKHLRAVPPALIYFDGSETAELDGLQLRIQGLQGVTGVNRLSPEPAAFVEIVVRLQNREAASTPFLIGRGCSRPTNGFTVGSRSEKLPSRTGQSCGRRSTVF